MIKDFEGKVAVVTGGAIGIGRGLAHAFAKRGCKIVLADVDEQALEKVSKELSEIGAEESNLTSYCLRDVLCI